MGEPLGIVHFLITNLEENTIDLNYNTRNDLLRSQVEEGTRSKNIHRSRLVLKKETKTKTTNQQRQLQSHLLKVGI